MKEPNIIEKLGTTAQANIAREDVLPVEPASTPGKKMMLFAAFFATLLLVGGIAGGYYLSLQRDEDVEISDESEASVDTDTDTDTVAWVDWEGEYLRARLPEGWEIVENKNDGYYKGLWSININNENGEILMEINIDFGVVGWVIDCNTPFYKFDDYSQALYQTHLDSFEKGFDAKLNSENSPTCPEEMNLYNFGSDYVNISFLGGNLRRVDSSYYGDYKSDDEFFTVEFTSSWLEGELWSDLYIDKDLYNEKIKDSHQDRYGVALLEEDKLERSVGDTIYYSFVENGTLDESDLLLLDQVLESIEIIPED